MPSGAMGQVPPILDPRRTHVSRASPVARTWSERSPRNQSDEFGSTEPSPYRVSRCTVCWRHQRQNFFSSRRSWVLDLFLVVT